MERPTSGRRMDRRVERGQRAVLSCEGSGRGAAGNLCSELGPGIEPRRNQPTLGLVEVAHWLEDRLTADTARAKSSDVKNLCLSSFRPLYWSSVRVGILGPIKGVRRRVPGCLLRNGCMHHDRAVPHSTIDSMVEVAAAICSRYIFQQQGRREGQSAATCW